ncbi:MAG: right-handed parallel beta-helix repeat-containing protein [Thiolinea sp.]
MADGISISSHTPLEQTPQQKINIDNNTISNIQRDGIILKNIGQYTISGNHIHSIHPNYEPIPYEQLKKASNAPDAAVTLPNGVLAQHADGIQVTNAKGGSIQNNDLTIGNGTWYQAINVHHETDSAYRNVSLKAPKDNQPTPVSIVNNIIENNHDFAINARHFEKVFSEPNSIEKLPLKGIRPTQEDMRIINIQLVK